MYVLMKCNYDPQINTSNSCFAQKTDLNPVGCYSSTPHDLTKRISKNYLKMIIQALRTFHYYLQITHKTIDHTQRLRNCHPSLILGQSIQSLDRGFYLAVA